MAITCITGVPRSGKSYYCVYLLYMSFVHVKKDTWLSKQFNKFAQKKLSKSYEIAYTNINQFDFSKSPKIKPFDYATIYAHLVNLHALHMAKKTDDELLFYAKANHLSNAIFIIDECQNYFDKDDLILTWWFTYHGHLHQDIMLITQNFDLIFKGYTKLGEFFYKAAKPSSRLFSSKFKYVQYNSYQCYEKDRIGTFLVPMLPEVFGMYVSGAANNAPSQVKKYLAYAFFMFLITMAFFFYFMSTLQPEKKSTPKLSQSFEPTSNTQYNRNSHTTKKDVIQEVDDNQTVLFDIKCVEALCRYNDVDFPRILLTKVVRDTKPDFVTSFKTSAYTQFYLMLPKKTFDFLQKKDTNTSKKDDKNGAIKGLNPLPTLSNK